jgi:sugar phosphate isomerase/epimerase
MIGRKSGRARQLSHIQEQAMTTQGFDRRLFLQGAAAAAAGLALGSAGRAAAQEAGKKYEISLAQWSLNRQFFGRGGAEKLDPMDFAKIAKNQCGINAIEYVNQFYQAAIKQPGSLAELKKRAEGEGVKSVLIMCDGEGNLGDPDTNKRITAVRNHIKWLEWATELGCHSIRVNAASSGSYEEQQKLAADGLRRLSEIGDTFGQNVIVENHGGWSSHGRWLADVMKMVDHPRCGTLPDFGNFAIQRGGRQGGMSLEYDKYLGLYELMPYAKGVSAKSYAFDENGNESSMDFAKLIKIALDSGFKGYVGIEFEGQGESFDGIAKTKALLEKIRDTPAA